MAHDFLVRLDGITLNDAEERELNEAIQSTVLAHLARIDKRGDFAAILRPDHGGTNGIVAVPTDDNEQLAQRIADARQALE